MFARVRGWRRDMGDTELGSPELSDANFHSVKDRPRSYRRDKTYVSRIFGSVHISWHAEGLSLNGDYQIEIMFSEDDIAKLVRHLFGKKLSLSAYNSLGVELSDEALSSIIQKMNINELIRVASLEANTNTEEK